MSFSFDLDIKERVRAATDIVDVIGRRLELRRQGRNYVALCPWHADRRPSLQVNPERQIWKCWVCDIGGDVFNFVMKDEGLTFPEALKKLADRAGIPLDDGPNRAAQEKRAASKRALLGVLEWAAEFYHQTLLRSPEATAARDYLKTRGVSDEAITRFQIGFAPSGWSTLIDAATRQKFRGAALQAAGLAIPRDSGGWYDRFRNRIMFPIHDRDGRTIAFGGRVLPGDDSAAKYINSPETPVFRKNQNLYGLDLAHPHMRRTRRAVIMEGYTDVVIAHQFGLENAVAVLGTALGPAHLQTLRHHCDTVVLLLDGDEAGQRRSDEVLSLFLQAQMDVRVLSLPDGLDPADYLLKHGPDRLSAEIEAAVDAFEFKMRRVASGFDPLLDTYRAGRAVEEMLSFLAQVSYSGLLAKDSFRVRQDQVLTRLARTFGVAETTLRERLTALRGRRSRSPAKPEELESAPKPVAFRPSDLSPFEREFFELLILEPTQASLLLERAQDGGVETPAARALLQVYEQLDFQGESLAYEDVSVAIEDEGLKHLLEVLHDQARNRLDRASIAVDERIRILTQRLGERSTQVRIQQLTSQLASRKLTADDEMQILQSIVAEQRARQGLALQRTESADVPATGASEAAVNEMLAEDRDAATSIEDSENLQ